MKSSIAGKAGGCLPAVYNAANEQLVRDHARLGGFPVDSVAQIVATIDPTTADASATGSL